MIIFDTDWNPQVIIYKFIVFYNSFLFGTVGSSTEDGLVFSWPVFIFQVDLQAQARAHRIGQKREVLVLRFETVSYDALLLFVLDVYRAFNN